MFDEVAIHCVKRVGIWSFLVGMQSKGEKIRTRKTPNTDTFHAVVNSRNSLATAETFSQ